MIWYISKTTIRASSYVIYADFEAILMNRYTDVNQIMINHIPNHIRSIKTVDMDMRLFVIVMIKYSKPIQIYRGENAVHKFMEKMLEEVEWCKK